jgi:hypothetical protein
MRSGKTIPHHHLRQSEAIDHRDRHLKTLFPTGHQRCAREIKRRLEGKDLVGNKSVLRGPGLCSSCRTQKRGCENAYFHFPSAWTKRLLASRQGRT